MDFDYILEKVPNLKQCDTLDMFAREGDWQSFHLNSKVKSLEAWEIEPSFILKLKQNLPESKIFCRNSIDFINKITDYTKFDLLIIDNGLNCYGEGYCEHFDFLHNIGNVLKDKPFIILNVVHKPFNYDKFPEWESRRNTFYNVSDSSNLNKEFVKNFYTDLFKSIGFNTINYHTVCREYHNGDDYLYYIGLELER
jgi:hypothetical protein